MVVNKCNITSIVKNYIDDKKLSIQSISTSHLLQAFIHTLGCSDKEIICLPELKECNLTETSYCELYISNITRELNENFVTFISELSSGSAPYQYLWEYDTTKLSLVSGTNTTSETLQLEWIDTHYDTATVTLKVTDSLGCKDSIILTLSTCVKCDNATFTLPAITNNLCSPSNIINVGGVDYYELQFTPTITCGLTSLTYKAVSTRLEIVGVTTDYANGFTSDFKFRIKVSDIGYLTTKLFRFYVELEDCVRYELFYTFNANEIPCCVECTNTTGTIDVINICTSEVIRNGIVYKQNTIQVSLACGADNIINYLQSVTLDVDATIDYIIEPIVGFNNKFNILIDKDDYDLYCSIPVPLGNLSLQGSDKSILGTLLNAQAYMLNFVGSLFTNESYDSVTDTYYFDLPLGTTLFSNTFDFCGVNSPGGFNGIEFEFIDNIGAVIQIDTLQSFNLNKRNNVIGDCIFFNDAFIGSLGINTLGKISVGNNFGTDAYTTFNIEEVLSAGTGFFHRTSAMSYSVDLNIGGSKIATTTGSNGLNIGGASFGSKVTLNVPIVMQTCDGGNPDGDLIDAVTNGVIINYI